MKCVIKFSLDNAAFHTDPYYNAKQKKATLDFSEIGRVISEVGQRIGNGWDSGSISDHNGNTVGEFSIKGR